MHQAFNALLQLDERAVVRDRKNAALDMGADGVALRGVEPRVGRQLLEAQRDTLLVLVELEHLHLDLVAHVDQVARMRQPAPAHIGDMEEAVDAAQVDERAVVGQVLHRAGEDSSLAQLLQGVRPLGGLLLLEDLLAADHHVAALLVQLDDADFDLLAEIAVEVADRPDLELRPGQECLHADVDRQATLDAADHRAHNGRLVVGRLLDGVPHPQALCLFVADKVAAFRLLALDHHVDHVARIEPGGACVVDDLLQGHHPPRISRPTSTIRCLSVLLEDRALHHLIAISFDSGGLGGLLAFECLERSREVLHMDSPKCSGCAACFAGAAVATGAAATGSSTDCSATVSVSGVDAGISIAAAGAASASAGAASAPWRLSAAAPSAVAASAVAAKGSLVVSASSAGAVASGTAAVSGVDVDSDDGCSRSVAGSITGVSSSVFRVMLSVSGLRTFDITVLAPGFLTAGGLRLIISSAG